MANKPQDTPNAPPAEGEDNNGTHPEPQDMAAPGPDQKPSQSEGEGKVSESDLMAVKESLKSVQSQLDEATKALQTERAARQAAEGKVVEADTLQKQVSDLQEQVKSKESAFTEIQGKMLEQRRESLSQRFGLDEETLKGLDQNQLELLEKTLPKAHPSGPQNANGFGASGAGGSDISKLPGRDKIRYALESQAS